MSFRLLNRAIGSVGSGFVNGGSAKTLLYEEGITLYSV
jgi:hypothetical protein